MLSAAGIVTATGGALSHAAVVSRALDKPCVVGCETIKIDLVRRTFAVGDEVFHEGDEISVDGGTGKIYAGAVMLGANGASRAALNRLLELADAGSQSSVWIAPRNAGEATESLAGLSTGVGVVRLTDLIMSRGSIDRFVRLISRLGSDSNASDLPEELAEIVRDSSAPLLAAAKNVPIHIRLSRLSSDRARRLIENWEEMPASLFLPLGSNVFFRALLEGLAEAAKATSHEQVTALIGNIVDGHEAQSFASIAGEFGLGAGALLQNAVSLNNAAEIASRCSTIWVDVTETIRTVYGFPTEVVQAEGAVDRYVADGFLRANPFGHPPPFLNEWLRSVAELSKTALKTAVGVDLSGDFSSTIVMRLRDMGFRQFATSPARRDELRLMLAQEPKE
jgi:pyruvate, orthophosphate dikinase